MNIFIVLGGRPGIYSNVYEHRAWIDKIMVPEHCFSFYFMEGYQENTMRIHT